MTSEQTIPFRNQPKVATGVEIPKPLKKRLEREAIRRGWSLSMMTSSVICRGLEMDPAEFGIPSGAANQA